MGSCSFYPYFHFNSFIFSFIFRDYYGVKMAFYFAWLGYYTVMLIPPSLVGFLYHNDISNMVIIKDKCICYPGWYFLLDIWGGHCLNRCHSYVRPLSHSDISFFVEIDEKCPQFSEICTGVMANTTMCPICDDPCQPWQLKDACTMTKVHLNCISQTYFSILLHCNMTSKGQVPV